MNKKDFDRDSNIVVKVIESPGWWKPDTSNWYMNITPEFQPE